MKVKMEPGAVMDVVSPDETRKIMHEALDHYTKMLSVGNRFPKVLEMIPVAQFTQQGIAGVQLTRWSPPQGFMWSVKRITLTQGQPSAANANIFVYLNSVNPSSLLFSTTLPTTQLFGDDSLVMLPDDNLMVVITNPNAGDSVYINGQVKEVPVSASFLAGNL